MEIIQNLIYNGAEDFYEHKLGLDNVNYVDVGGEGVISINDAILILRYIVGLITTFPIEEHA